MRICPTGYEKYSRKNYGNTSQTGKCNKRCNKMCPIFAHIIMTKLLVDMYHIK